ncbi:SubName: Full=Uncharacterized protein {ECO:0000313/EMBL:CCA68732.1} [Serendipita indica DSM 11827]|uniref:HAM1-like N-terminal domain-containing protein n=1 Tax=Serendipita indica (strain DSM 11827) TaxID=1109443 RepID=G4TBP9_SERID|nr:SubName: Full=Uncharacterized protein {ECO:0000313/EMBL:CCA68732.1} [Serendipita indica DSM 11827]CCA68732.1 hypothetical protein PIIN_02596 [Serendipita indica DSM 11827]
MGSCCSSLRKRGPRGGEREPLLPQYAPEVPPQSQFDKFAQIIGAIQAGKYPSQEQINKALRMLLASDLLKATSIQANGPLSAHGRRIIEDTRSLVQALLTAGMEKNDDDRIQDLLWHLSQVEEVPLQVNIDVDANASLGLQEGASRLPTNVVSQEELADDMRKAASSIQSLLSLLMTSHAFRLIISDVLVTARDILADVASDVAKVAALVEDRAEQLEESIRPTEVELASEKERQGGVGIPSLETLANRAEPIPERVAEVTKSAIQETEARRRAVWDRMEEEDPDRIKEAVLRRVREIIEQAQASPRYTAALATMGSLIRKYVQKLSITAAAIGDAVQTTASSADASITLEPHVEADPHLHAVLEDLKLILERFSGHGLDLLGEKLVILVRDLSTSTESEGERLSDIVEEATKWLHFALLHPGWVQSEEAQNAGSKLYDSFVQFLHRNPRYKADARSALEEAYALIDAFAADKTTNLLLSAIQTLMTDFGILGAVGPQVLAIESAKQWEVLKAELWRDILAWILPRLLRALKTIPLPRVELKSETLDMVIDKVTLSSPSFIPDHVQISNHTDFTLKASDATPDSFFETATSTQTRIKIDGLRISVEDIAYYINAKGPLCLGWLDNGLMTVDVGAKRVEGDGISLLLDIEVPSQENRETADIFRVLDAKVGVPGLAFRMERTRHWIFNALVTQPLLAPLVRTGASLVLSTQIRAGLEAMNAALCKVRDRAVTRHGPDPSVEAYLDALAHPDAPRPSTPSSASSARSSSPTADHTFVETEVTTKGIIRTTVQENERGEPQTETVLAVGIGEQILPGIGGPEPEPAPTLVEQGREALDELDGARQLAKDTADEVREARETVQTRVAAAGERMRRTRSNLAKRTGWRSSAFDV